MHAVAINEAEKGNTGDFYTSASSRWASKGISNGCNAFLSSQWVQQGQSEFLHVVSLQPIQQLSLKQLTPR